MNLTLPSGWFGTWTAGDDVALEMAMYRAYHRWMADYCGAYPEPARRRDPGRRARYRGQRSARSAAGVKSRWAWGVMVYAPVGMPLDHPGARAALRRSRRTRPCRCAAHLHGDAALCAGRAGYLGQSVAAALGGASLVRHAQHGGDDRQRGDGPLPDLAHRHAGGRARLAAVLDGAARRACRDDQSGACPNSSHKPSEYVTGGRYFQSIEIPEGAKLTNAVIDLVGDHVLMYASDYPHGESHFPEFGLAGGGLGDGQGAKAQAAMGQCHPLLRTRFSLTRLIREVYQELVREVYQELAHPVQPTASSRHG